MLTLLIISFVVVISSIYKAHRNTREVAVNTVAVPGGTVRGGAVPGGPGGKSGHHSEERQLHILHISDMHLENISISPDQIYDKLQGEQIDLIALTGDFLDRKRSIPRLIPYLEVFNLLNPRYGIYAVFGNHDYVLDAESFAELKRTLEQYNCHTLQNENHTLWINGRQVHIIGVDDYSTRRSCLYESYAGLEDGTDARIGDGTDARFGAAGEAGAGPSATEGSGSSANMEVAAGLQADVRAAADTAETGAKACAEPAPYNLVLTHDPNVVLEMEDFEFDYLLSGHFHGGQIHWPKPYHLKAMGELVRMKMVKGLHYHHGKPFYISEGLGQTAVNIRVGSRPEMTIHQLSLPQPAAKSNQEKTLRAV